MYSPKISMVTNDVELLLAEHKCTIAEVEEIIDLMQDSIKEQKKRSQVNFKPVYSLMMYGLTDTFRDKVPAVDIANIDPLKFVNVK